jgi:hypothetical protein
LLRVAPILLALVLLGCGASTEGGISGGGKIIGRTVTVYSLATDPAATSKDFVDGQKLALKDAGGRAGNLAVNFSSLDLGSDDADAAEAARRAINDPQIIAAIVDATPVTVPLFNAAGVLQVAPGGDATPPPALLPSGRPTVMRTRGTTPPDFVARFRDAFGHPPSGDAGEGYRAMAGILAAIERAGAAGNDRTRVIDSY